MLHESVNSIISMYAVFFLYMFSHDGGSFDMAIFSVDVTSVVELGKDADGRLSVTSAACDAKVEDLDLEIHGGARYSRKKADTSKG